MSSEKFIIPNSGGVIDFAAFVRAGMPKPAPPEIGRRSDGARLFYKGRVNMIFGPSGTGKTWLALSVVRDVIRTGGRVGYIDADNNGAGGIGSRLVAMGLSTWEDYDRFYYAQPDTSENLQQAVTYLIDNRIDLVIFDSVYQITSLAGLDSNSNDDFTSLNRKFFIPPAQNGACVIILDNTGHATGDRARGASSKRDALDGVQVEMGVVTGFAPGSGGRARLHVPKDRWGGVVARCAHSGNRQLFGEFVMDANGEVTITAPAHTGPPAMSPGDRAKAAQWGGNADERGAAQIVDYLLLSLHNEGSDELTQLQLVKQTRKSDKTVRKWIKAGVDNHWLEVSQESGKKKVVTLGEVLPVIRWYTDESAQSEG